LVSIKATHELAVDVMNSMPGYKAEFKKIFGKDAATVDMVTDTIATFEALTVFALPENNAHVRKDVGVFVGLRGSRRSTATNTGPIYEVDG
jgi:hypothetical protein